MWSDQVFVADLSRVQKPVRGFQGGSIMQLLGQRGSRLCRHRVRNGHGTTIAPWIAQLHRAKGGLCPQQWRQQCRWWYHHSFPFSLTTSSLILSPVVDQTCDTKSGFTPRAGPSHVRQVLLVSLRVCI